MLLWNELQCISTGCQMGTESCFCKSRILCIQNLLYLQFSAQWKCCSSLRNPSHSHSQCMHLSNSQSHLCSISLIVYTHLFTGVLILLALSLLTPYFYFIPKASLAAVIICAVIFMIEYEVVKPMWKSSRKFKSFVMPRVLGLYTQQLPLTMGGQWVASILSLSTIWVRVQKYHILTLSLPSDWIVSHHGVIVLYQCRTWSCSHRRKNMEVWEEGLRRIFSPNRKDGENITMSSFITWTLY